jgi:lysophospholipase L1-like esterase
VVSILIGINDTWRRFDSNDPTTADEYERSFRHILERTRRELEARIVICEPFLLSVSHERDSYRIDLDPKIQIARRLAREYGHVFVPLDGLFAAASVHRPPGTWAEDGVHPTASGHALIADAWMRAVSAE